MKQTINFILRAIFALSAAGGLTAAANAQVSNNPCSDSSGNPRPDFYNVAIDDPRPGSRDRCLSVPMSADNSPSEPPSSDRAGLTVFLYPHVLFALPANRTNAYIWVRNDSGSPVSFSRGDGYLYPQDTDYPRLPLSALSAADVMIPAGMDGRFTLTNAGLANALVDRVIRSADGILYYGTPAGENGGCPQYHELDADSTNCVPMAAPTDCDEASTDPMPGRCECKTGFDPIAGDDTMCMPTDDDDGDNPDNPDDPGNGETPDNPGNGDNPRTSTPPQRGDHDYVPAIAGGVGILLLAGWQILTDGGGTEDFSFSPDFGYAITESGYSYKYGGRVDFRKDAWSLYWTAGQRNANGEFGDFRYASGGEYDGGFWRASFSESVVGETTDYDFSLSAAYAGGIWKVSPEFFADARYKNGEFAMTNSFRISGEMRVDDWRLSAVGSAERVRLSAVRSF